MFLCKCLPQLDQRCVAVIVSSKGLILWTAEMAAAQRFGMSYADVEDAALSAGLLPTRYERNQNTISIEDQRTLLHSRVVVVGCGGLGG